MSRGSRLPAQVEVAEVLVAMCAAVTDHTDRLLAIERARDLLPTLDSRQLGLLCEWSEALTLPEIDRAAVAACLTGMAETHAAEPFDGLGSHHGFSSSAAARSAILRGSGR